MRTLIGLPTLAALLVAAPSGAATTVTLADGIWSARATGGHAASFTVRAGVVSALTAKASLGCTTLAIGARPPDLAFSGGSGLPRGTRVSALSGSKGVVWTERHAGHAFAVTARLLGSRAHPRLGLAVDSVKSAVFCHAAAEVTIARRKA